MGKLIYSPTDPGDVREVDAFGVAFTAGKAVDVSDTVFAKLKGNPQFKVGSASDAKAPEPKTDAPKVDGRSKAARAARATAAEDEAKARAAEHEADLAEAKEEAKAEKARSGA